MNKMILTWLLYIGFVALMINMSTIAAASEVTDELESYSFISSDNIDEKRMVILFKDGDKVPSGTAVCQLAKSYGYTVEIITLFEGGRLTAAIRCK